MTTTPTKTTDFPPAVAGATTANAQGVPDQLQKLTQRVDQVHAEHAQLSARYQTLKAKGEVSEEEDNKLLTDVIIFSALEDAAVQALYAFKEQPENAESAFSTALKVSELFKTLRGNVVESAPAPKPAAPPAPAPAKLKPLAQPVHLTGLIESQKANLGQIEALYQPILDGYLNRAKLLSRDCNSLEEYITLDREMRALQDDIAATRATILTAVKEECGIELKGEFLAIDFSLDKPDTSFGIMLKATYDSITASITPESQAKKLRLTREWYLRKDMGAGGNCFYRAIAGAVCGGTSAEARAAADKQHLNLRKDLHEHMTQNQGLYFESIATEVTNPDGVDAAELERYFTNLATPGEWGGGNAEIQGMSDMLRRPIVIVKGNQVPEIIQPRLAPNTYPLPHVVISFTPGHYQAMLPKPSKSRI